MLVSIVFVLATLARAEGGVEVAEESVYTIPKPTDLFFYETFEDGWNEKWIPSTNAKYDGVWEVKSNVSEKSLEGEAGLFVTEPAKHYAISTKFDKPIAGVEGQDLVIQYEVRLHETLACGGAYLKLLAADPEFSAAQFDNDTPYIIMFGPDKCGTNEKIHFIFRHQNPITSEWEEKHLQHPGRVRNDGNTHVYTLVIKKDNTYEILIDQVSVKTGSLFLDFEPAVNPPQEIDDPEDSKPSDWIEDEEMDDLEQTKPEDWDEDAAPTVEDPAASKPAGWCDDCAFKIDDPEAEMPEDWDEEEDGAFEKPLIDNPVCLDPGCGDWAPPQIANPEYKGKWIQPRIANPDYVGPWLPRQIPNPSFFEDLQPHKMAPIGGVGIEIWTMQANMEFDNIVIDTSAAAAALFADQTFAMKQIAEKSDDGGVAGVFGGALGEYGELIEENLYVVIGVFAAVALGIVALLWICCCTGEAEDDSAAAAPAQAAAAPAEEDDEGEEEEVEEKEEKKKAGVPKKRKGKSGKK